MYTNTLYHANNPIITSPHINISDPHITHSNNYVNINAHAF
jgi:hypothetical protein